MMQTSYSSPRTGTHRRLDMIKMEEEGWSRKEKLAAILATLTTLGTYIIIIEIALANGWM